MSQLNKVLLSDEMLLMRVKDELIGYIHANTLVTKVRMVQVSRYSLLGGFDVRVVQFQLLWGGLFYCPFYELSYKLCTKGLKGCVFDWLLK